MGPGIGPEIEEVYASPPLSRQPSDDGANTRRSSSVMPFAHNHIDLPPPPSHFTTPITPSPPYSPVAFSYPHRVPSPPHPHQQEGNVTPLEASRNQLRHELGGRADFIRKPLNYFLLTLCPNLVLHS